MMTPETLHWSATAPFPLLGLLQLLPLAAALLFHLSGARRWTFRAGITLALLMLVLTSYLFHLYDTGDSRMQLSEQLHLLGPLSYHVAADGITVLFLLLNALITLLVIIYGQVRALPSGANLMALVFATQAALVSLLVTIDLVWFAVMSVVQLIPIGYLLWNWASSPDKDLALTRFLQFMITGALLLLAGALMLGWNHADQTGVWSFDLISLAQTPVPESIGSLVFFLLFYGLAIRTPLFPFHGWLPMMAEHGTVALAPVFLLGLKVGIYGMLRFLFPLLPDAVMQWHPFVVAFATGGIFYAALLALLQVNLRRLLAFAVVSHTSVLVIGLFSLGYTAFQGSVLLAINFGLAITGLLFMSGLIYRRTRTLRLSHIGGLFDRIPLIGITFFIAGLAIVGMPGTPGFDAVHLMLEDAMHRFGALVTIAAALGNVVAAGFLLISFQRAFLSTPGQDTDADVSHIERINLGEKVIVVILILVILGSGFYSEPWLDLVEGPSRLLSLPFDMTEGH